MLATPAGARRDKVSAAAPRRQPRDRGHILAGRDGRNTLDFIRVVDGFHDGVEDFPKEWSPPRTTFTGDR